MLKRIKVYPNKWLALDALGNPCAAVPIDFHEHGPGRKWVGCKLKATLTKAAQIQKVKHVEQEIAPAEYQTEWVYADGPVEIPRTDYYVDRIKSGELFIADEESAKIAEVPFMDPIAAIEASKAAAIKAYDAQHGEGAWANIHLVITASNEPALVIEAPPDLDPAYAITKNSTAGKSARKSSTPQE